MKLYEIINGSREGIYGPTRLFLSKTSAIQYFNDMIKSNNDYNSALYCEPEDEVERAKFTLNKDSDQNAYIEYYKDGYGDYIALSEIETLD